MSAVLWAALGGIALLTESVDPRVGTATAQLGLSLLTVAFGLSVFWRHGGRQITAAGLFALATAVFVGAAGVYWWFQLGAGVPRGLLLATAVGYFSLVAMHQLFWRGCAVPQEPPPADAAVTRWGMAAGLAVAGPVLALHLAGLDVGATLTGEVIFGGMAVVIVSVLAHPGRIGPTRLLVVGVVGGVYALTVFTGYGRLLLVSLGMVALVPACRRLPGHSVKVLVVAAVGPAMAALINAREQFGVATYGAALDGSGSITQPLADFGRIIDLYDHGLLGLGYGSTFLVSAVFFVPRLLWPGKPPGFGTVLTQILEPELLSIDQSLAAHLGAEWLYDFGWPGIAAMVLVMGWAIGRLDGFAADRLARPLVSRRSLIVAAAAVLLLAGIPDLEWAGTFTYWSRTASRLLVLLGLLLVATRTPVREAGRSSPAAVGSAGPR
jgi:hypothetical protein